MSKELVLDPRSERMLELLSKGGSSRELAEKLGYQEGTMRVYLHHLYKKVGVANKTEAVIWWLKRTSAASTPVVAGEGPAEVVVSDDLFGEMALSEGLYSALGVMSAFIGPYSRQWEVAHRLEEGDEDEDGDLQARRERSRKLFRALLQGDWAYGKRMFDVDAGASLLVDASADAALLTALLAFGGYTSAAERMQGQLTPRRKAAGSHREAALMRALSRALDGEARALDEIQDLATERAAPAGFKQVAHVVLFHAYAARKDVDRARKTANLVWNEAEAAKQQLIAMGDRPFGGSRASAAVAKPTAKRSGAREKATVR
jgi:DNA-binding CsgD family transcriptional regulator